MKKIKDNIYEWALRNLPYKVMYKRIKFDGHDMWWPRFGYTQRQIDEADARAKYLHDNIKWE